MNFSTFVGNENLKDKLSFLLQSGRMPHAIIIEGEEGLGKHTLAKELAVNLLCRESKNNACFSCAQCRKVQSSIHPDVFEYTAPNTAAGFHVGTVRDIINSAYMQPNEADYKIYILGNCQSMNLSAQNAFLKLLEEPPAYAVFILLTTTKSAMLETVLSRCVTVSVEGVDAKQGADFICLQHSDISFDDAQNAINAWNGNIGKALQSLNDGKLSKISSIANDICCALVQDNEYALLTACSVFEKDRDTLVSSLSLLKSIFRDAMLYGSGDMMSGQNQSAQLLSRNFSKEKLIALISACDQIRSLALKNGNNNILITKICYQLRMAVGR